jgi:hypothetical protein
MITHPGCAAMNKRFWCIPASCSARLAARKIANRDIAARNERVFRRGAVPAA